MTEKESSFTPERASKETSIYLDDDPKKLEGILKETWENNESLRIASETEKFKTEEQVKKKQLYIEEGQPWDFFVSDSVTFETNDRGGKKIDFRSLAPPDVSFANSQIQPHIKKPKNRAAEKWGYYGGGPQDKEAKFILYGGLDRVGDRLLLLHEIGHSWQKPKGEVDELFKNLKKDYEYAKEAKMKKVGPGEVFFRPGKKGELRPVDLEEVLDYVEIESEEERQAWSFALHKLHEFRLQGIDLEPSLEHLEEIKNIVHGKEGLGSYENFIKEHFPKNPELHGFYNHNYNRKSKKG